MTDIRTSCVIRDPVSGETIGLNIVKTRPLLIQSANPMAVRTVTDQDYNAFSEWSIIQGVGYNQGLGLEFGDKLDPNRFYESQGLDTRIRDQLILAPLPVSAIIGTDSFAVATTHTTNYWPFASTGSYQKLAQSFTVVGSGSFAVTKIALRLSTAATSGNVTLRVETDTAGSPSGTLAHANATKAVAIATTIGATTAWVTFTFTSFNITKGTTYWLVLSTDQATNVMAHACMSDSYATYTSKVYTGAAWLPSGSYGAFPYGFTGYGTNGDLYFLLLDQTDTQGNVTAFTYYNGVAAPGMFMAGGTTIYILTAGAWVASKSGVAAAVTDLASYNGTLWAACSGTATWSYTEAGGWVDATGAIATGAIAEYFLVWKGYFYRALYNSTSHDNEVYWTADCVTWYGPWPIGDGYRGERITGLVGMTDEVYVLTTHGLYGLGTDVVFVPYQLKDWTTQWDADNGKNVINWDNTGQIYFPLLQGLLRFDGSTLANVGPGAKDAGLTSTRAGPFTCLESLTNWLLAGNNAGTGIQRSGIYVYNNIGWHEFITCPALGVGITALAFDASTSPHRLWFGYGTKVAYIQMSDLGDNPYLNSSINYTSTGWLITPWYGAELYMVDKDYNKLGLRAEIPASTSISVEYEIDHSNVWKSLGTMSKQPTQQFSFEFESAFSGSAPTVNSISSDGYTVYVDSTSEISANQWLRINNETRQVASTTAGVINFEAPFIETVASGDRVYPSKPVGREIRFRFTLASTNSLSTPKLLSWWLEYMPMIMDREAGSIEADVADTYTNAAGTVEYQDAEAVITLLRGMVRRRTPVYMDDMRGLARLVKINRMSERQMRRESVRMNAEPGVKSVVTLSFVEV